ncbi:hypothetical protein AN395_02360 [Pseudoalteromonas sp. P1-30]|uniref:hypothetical protein n=1 Tax=Pseudoalteromonas sp. P1-30 TaxID=1723760 RepID=UPI0006D5E7D2|nr:hypothetical protein [Pseudoalteromonas sp. P1-30]KPV91257.1 hypothetical protein AN395_02360 [Pseudoalteromonas sp. P1-30]
MNKFTLIIPALIVLTGCKSNDITRAVKDGINGAVNGVSSSTNQSITSSNQSSYTTTQTKVYPHEATKESRDYGQIQVIKTAANPNKQTN